MALSNLDKNNIKRLFNMLSINDINVENNKINDIKSDYVLYGKLEIIANQMNNLELQARNIIETHNLSKELTNIEIKMKLVPGTYYYLYNNNGKKIISLISNYEWGNRNDMIFINKLFYDFDYNFYIVE